MCARRSAKSTRARAMPTAPTTATSWKRWSPPAARRTSGASCPPPENQANLRQRSPSGLPARPSLKVYVERVRSRAERDVVSPLAARETMDDELVRAERHADAEQRRVADALAVD